MRVQHNIAAMNSYRNYGNNTKTINKNLEKLSSGYKINRAGDDAAGLAISEKMRAQITGLEVAQKNAKDGISLVQTAEGALTEVHSMLNRMFELAEQSANGTYDTTLDRQQLQKEVSALRTEINRIRDSSNFNGQKLFDGSLDGTEIKSDTIGIESVDNITWASGVTDAKKADLAKALVGAKLTITAAADSNGAFSMAAANNADVALSGDNLGDFGLNTSGTAFSYSGSAAKGTLTFDIMDSSSGTAKKVATFKVNIKDGKASETAELSLGTGSNLKLQIGDTADAYNQMDVNVSDIHSDVLGVGSIDISTVAGAQGAMNAIKTAINTVSDVRGGLGAIQNRLEHTISNLSVMQENMQDAESTIRDTDVAAEMMKYTKNSILVQSAQAMLAQANQQPQGVLQLLQ